MNNSVLSPLVFLHWFFPVKLLMADVAFKRTVVAVGAFVDLKLKGFILFLLLKFFAFLIVYMLYKISK